MLGTVFAASRAHDRCRQFLELLAPHADLVANNVNAPFVAVAHVLGVLETALGHHDEADAHFARALEIHERFGPLLAAHTRVDWAKALVERCETDRARPLLDEALVVARQHRYPLIERLASEVRAEMEKEPSPDGG